MGVLNLHMCFVRLSVSVLVVMFCSLSSNAQIQQQHVIGSIGGYGQTSQGSVYYTVGEISMIKTFISGSNMLTQGFLQGGMISLVPNISGALPITLIDFSGYYDNGSDYLQWKTATETDNAYFDVQKMTTNGEFQSIGTVKGAGTSNIEHSYSLVDPSPLAGVNYYRLRQVDIDGNFSFSNIISIATPMTEAITVSIYPNPAKNYVNISINSTESYTGMLTVTDIIGNVVYQNAIASGEGPTQTGIDISGYGQGQYIIRFTSSAMTTTCRVTKQF
jgi:hypothetical protein